MFFFQKMRKHTLEEKPAKIDNCIEEKDKKKKYNKGNFKKKINFKKG